MAVSPSFSVCIPCYNSRRFLGETLAALRNQSWPDWDLIVVEDGSPEPVGELVAAFAATVPQRVRYLPHPENRGLPAARDTAFAAATGSHLAPLDHDDTWEPDHLAALAAAIIAHDADITFSGSRMLEFDSGTVRARSAPTERDLADLPESIYTQRFWVIPSAVALRRSLLERTGPWSAELDRLSPRLRPARSRGEDYSYWLRAMRAGARWAWSGACTLNYRWHTESLSKRSGDSIVYHALLYNAQSPVPGMAPARQAGFVARLNTNAGKFLCARGERRAAWPFWWAWRRAPRRVSNLLLAAGALLSPRLTAKALRRAGRL